MEGDGDGGWMEGRENFCHCKKWVEQCLRCKTLGGKISSGQS